ncbi:hypothetical protein H9L25_00555 [Terrisporobacter mayombei]|nr:hypothetical protein [Terrisporobacter mayombei]
MYIIQVNGRFYYGENESNKSEYGYYMNKAKMFPSLDSAKEKGIELKTENKSSLVIVEKVMTQTVKVINI